MFTISTWHYIHSKTKSLQIQVTALKKCSSNFSPFLGRCDCFSKCIFSIFTVIISRAEPWYRIWIQYSHGDCCSDIAHWLQMELWYILSLLNNLWRRWGILFIRLSSLHIISINYHIVSKFPFLIPFFLKKKNRLKCWTFFKIFATQWNTSLRNLRYTFALMYQQG